MSVLNSTIGRVLLQLLFIDTRNIATFLDMVLCLLLSKSVSLSAWTLWMSDNTKAESRFRRFARWLDNSSITSHVWYTPLFLYAMREWSRMPIYIALDTSMLYDRFCCVRISMIYMNRAIPVTWCVLEHNSSTVKYERYAHLFEWAKVLLPKDVEIIFLADRGFVCKNLIHRIRQLRWTWRIRVKNNQKLQTSKGFITPKTLPLSPGKVLLFSQCINFGKGLERLSLSAGWAKGSEEPWYVLSENAAGTEIFMDYARRFGIEEGFRDEKSGGCDLEVSRIRDAQKLELLLLVISTALIVAVSEGMTATLTGKREEVDPHRLRNLSYFQIGLRWILSRVVHGLKKMSGDCLLNCLLRPMSESLPVASTKKESRKRRKKKDPAYLFNDVQHGTL